MDKYVKVAAIICVIVAAFLCGRITIDVEFQCSSCDHVECIESGSTNAIPTNAVSSASTNEIAE